MAAIGDGARERLLAVWFLPLDQIPQIAVQIFEDSDRPVRLIFGLPDDRVSDENPPSARRAPQLVRPANHA